jgi:3',5'-cyclic-AMP phosphodiesterase
VQKRVFAGAQTLPVLIAQISDVHVGGGRYRQELLRTAIDEINAAEPDLVVVAGDLTDDGYPDQYPLAREELARIACEQVVRVPGNHDARNVGYLRFEDTFGARDSRLRLEAGPRRGRDRARALRLDRGGLGRVDGDKRERPVGKLAASGGGGRRTPAGRRRRPIPGTGRERNQFVRPQRGVTLVEDDR